MKKTSILLLILLLALCLAVPTFAAESNPRLVDNADLLERYEEAELLDTLDEISSRLKFDVVIVTTRDYAHERYIIKALEFGCDVISEKPLTTTAEMAARIIETEKPVGVVAAFGGQTAIKLTEFLDRSGVQILGTSQDSIDLAEDRERFDALLEERKNGGAFTPGLLQQLLNYYENGQWLADYTLDEQGVLPAGLKRGVLSQDAVFHFLAQLSEENIG